MGPKDLYASGAYCPPPCLVSRGGCWAAAPSAAHVTVNPGFFADNYLGNGLTALAANLGLYPLPLREGRNAPPSNEDIARVVVAVLLDPAPHAGRHYRPTGPAMLSVPEVTGVLDDAVGRRVRHLPVPMSMFLRALRVTGPRHGIGPYQMSTVRWYYPEHALGAWEVGGPTTDVRDVTGAEPGGLRRRRRALRPPAGERPDRRAHRPRPVGHDPDRPHPRAAPRPPRTTPAATRADRGGVRRRVTVVAAGS